MYILYGVSFVFPPIYFIHYINVQIAIIVEGKEKKVNKKENTEIELYSLNELIDSTYKELFLITFSKKISLR